MSPHNYKVYGITFGDSYSNAVSQIEQFYGNELICLKIMETDNSNVLEQEDYEDCKKIFNGE